VFLQITIKRMETSMEEQHHSPNTSKDTAGWHRSVTRQCHSTKPSILASYCLL